MAQNTTIYIIKYKEKAERKIKNPKIKEKQI
jgi:hypothetical protein